MFVLLLTLTATADSVAQERGERERAVRERLRAVEVAAQRGWLGFSYDPDTEGSRTVTVTDVFPGSPAARAGLRTGDTIIRLNGRAPTPETFRELRLEPGDRVRLRVRRDEREREITIVAAERPRRIAGRDFHVLAPSRVDGDRVIIIEGDTVRIALDSLRVRADSLHRRLRVLMVDSLGPQLRVFERRLRENEPEIRALQERARILADSLTLRFRGDLEPTMAFRFDVGRHAIAGAEFAEMNPELAEYFRGAREGVLVLRVASGTPAARAGLEAGDVVVRAGGETVRSVGELRRAVARAGRDDEPVRLTVVRKGQTRELRLGRNGE